MKKVLVANTLELHVNTHEHIDDYMSILEKYFNIIGHHCGSHHCYNKNALLIYSSFPEDMRCSGCEQVCEDINITKVPDVRIGDAFYENASIAQCSRLININYAGRFVGKLCKKNNVLWMTDIAHSSGNSAHITKIFQTLLDRKLLKNKSKPRIKSKKISVTLGADPEFEAKINNTDVSAYDLLSFNTREKAYISHDGRTQPQREMRPDPANTPGELVENIRDLIRISSFFGEDLYVTGNRMPLGGHIHVGNATASVELITAMDYFFFPLFEFNSALRKASPYGKAGDIRAKTHGFEYRTLPSAWLATPILATMTLELMKVIVEEMINGKEIMVEDKFDTKTYREDLNSLGFSNEWCDKFAEELANLSTNMTIPLATSWDCEIPKRYKVRKSYRSVTRSSSSVEVRPIGIIANEEEIF